MSSSSDKTATSAGGQQQPPASKIPAGLETLYALEKEHVKSSLSVLILAVHWSIVRAGLRIPTATVNTSSASVGSSSCSNDKKFTERLPKGWANESPTNQFTYDYVDPVSPNVHYQVKVIEIVRDTTAVVTVTRLTPSDTPSPSDSASSSGLCKTSSQTSASTFELQSFIRFDLERTVQEQVSAEAVFYNADKLEKQIWSELMEPLGLKVIGLPPFQGPYDDKVKQEGTKESEQQQQQQQQRQPLIYHDDPLRDDRFIPRPLPGIGGLGRPGPPAGPAGGFNPFPVPGVGGGGLGRSDLDPLGGIGAGMVADPRGFRTPRVGPPGRLPPGAVPPGARFDPFGPPNPTNPGQTPNWAVPNPDHDPPPPGFDDMFM